MDRFGDRFEQQLQYVEDGTTTVICHRHSSFEVAGACSTVFSMVSAIAPFQEGPGSTTVSWLCP